MNPASIANLGRSMRAFLALVTKLEQIGLDPEFRHVFIRYNGPSWEKELLEAQECLREAKTLVASPHSADSEVPGAAISPRTGR